MVFLAFAAHSANPVTARVIAWESLRKPGLDTTWPPPSSSVEVVAEVLSGAGIHESRNAP
jgi:hypothetical protein